MKWILILLTTVYTSMGAPDTVIRGIHPDDVCAAVAVYEEARGEGFEGKRAVLDVIQSRSELKKQSFCKIVKSKRQFSWYKGGRLSATDAQMEDYWTVARMKPVVKGSTHFHANYVSPPWRKKMKLVKKVGRHLFYKNKEK